MNTKIVFIVVLIITILMSGCAQQEQKITGFFIGDSAQQEEKYTRTVEEITVAAFEGDIATLVYLAQDQGYFKENGLDVTINDYEAGKLAAEALFAGEADISTTADAAFVSKSFDNPDLRILGTVSRYQNKVLVARKDQGINRIQDIKGKKVGVTKGSSGEYYFGIFLLFHGLSLEDMEIIDLKPSEIFEAIANGEIDAGFTWEPNIYNLRKELGENGISWHGQYKQEGYFLLLAKENWIKAHPEATKRFLKALIGAENFAKNNPAEIREYAKSSFNYEEDYVDYILQKNTLLISLPKTLIIALEDIARWRIKNSLTDEKIIPDYNDYIYFDALEEVKPRAVTITHY